MVGFRVCKQCKAVFLVSALLTSTVSWGQSVVDMIDTRVGTAASVTRTAGMFGRGTEEYAHTLPAVLSPFGMNFWTPQTQRTEKKGVCPYLYDHEVFQGIRCSHWIVGGCTQDYGSFTIMPCKSVDDCLKGCAFSHDDERATPAYYSLSLQKSGISVELTATQRSGFMRFSFENRDSMFLLITVNSDEGQGRLEVRKDGTIVGENPIHRIYQGWGEPAGYASHFVIRCDARVADKGRIDDNTIWVRLEKHSGMVNVRCANSFTSINAAENNLLREIPDWDFERVRSDLTSLWEDCLTRVEVFSNDSSLLSQFYGAMYRSSFLPHDISDVDGSYPAFSNGECVDGGMGSAYYDDFSMWDTYRAQHPLLTIREPMRAADMMRSLVTKYMQGGWMPIFPCWNSYTAAMIGDHCASVIADAYVKGIRDFDVEKAYEGLRKNAFCEPETYEEYVNGMGRRALSSYKRVGFIPLEDSVKEAFHQNEQVSRTLEYAYDDFALAQLAKALGKKDDYKELTRRSGNYVNVFDFRTGWVNGRHENGTFASSDEVELLKEPERHGNPTSLTPCTFSTFITEGLPVHYSWYVPHDVSGLIKCMGGARRFEEKLDSMFDCSLYWHGNEPCHQIAYLYDFIGKQEKCARVVRRILETEYMNEPGGLSGNDDAGQMSAWYIFSSLGFYPVCPGTDRYYLSCPVFRRADIKVGRDKRFTVVRDGDLSDDTSLRGVYLNGKRLKRTFITHDEIMRGGVLEFYIY